MKCIFFFSEVRLAPSIQFSNGHDYNSDIVSGLSLRS